MRVLWVVFRREVLSYFQSPVAYVILLVFLLINGITFYYFLTLFDGLLTPIVSQQYGFLSFWLLMILVPPLLTMRSFAEERRTGTYELLVTTGVEEALVVLAKFLSALFFFALLWAGVLFLFVLMETVGDLDWGVLMAVQVGILLLGSLFTSVGVLASSFTQNQLIAAAVAMIGALFLFFVHFFRFLFEAGRYELRYFDYVSPYYHFQNNFTQGILDLRYVVLYLSLTAFFLFLAVKVLERRRWW